MYIRNTCTVHLCTARTQLTYDVNTRRLSSPARSSPRLLQHPHRITGSLGDSQFSTDLASVSQARNSPSPLHAMRIELGLSRILKLLPTTSFTWRALHVAGTNSKGSVCAYLSASLHSSGIRTGRFTSPHLLDRCDSIVLNERIVDASLFH